MTTVEKPASLIEESAAQILTTVVERGLRPEVLQRTMAAIFADWTPVAEQERTATLTRKLSELGIIVQISTSESGETMYTMRYNGTYAMAPNFDGVLINLVATLLRKQED